MQKQFEKGIESLEQFLQEQLKIYEDEQRTLQVCKPWYIDTCNSSPPSAAYMRQ